ncbi:transport and Golgi organization protein 6 [Drosophila sulfurigaster albostrigata]|uniref:transport and Golgi organization protein 6 n=1 Tax=Drosophila sulfurigaster albostrigata TaxID=89887 RepID=UPI002D21CEDD|nr:transport and Golgi organization protein 6 [Drosophila sulfurigaster albostrigata]
MINIAKYFALLEKLSFEHALANESKTQNSTNSPQTSASITDNLKHLEKYVLLDVAQQLQELCNALGVEEKIDTNDNTINCYIIRLLHVLHTLSSNINFHSDAREDLISVAHLKLCIQTTQELSYYALRCQLHQDFYKSPVFKNFSNNDLSIPTSLLLLSIQFFITRLLPIRQLNIANAMELVQRDLLAAIMSLRTQQLPVEQQSQLNAALSYLWQNESKADFFRHVLLLKATPQLSPQLAKQLHQQLLHKLSLPHGFASLIAALHTASQNLDSTRSAEVVAHIVAQRGYSPRLQQQLIEQIFDYCRLQLSNVNSMIYGVLSLRRLCELNETNRASIEHILTAHCQPLVQPEDLLSGLIIWEQSELTACLQLWQQLFCSSSVACLPSSLLIPYIPLLLQLHEQLPAGDERKSVSALISRCLDNRDAELELPQQLQRLLSWQLDENPPWQSLHQHVALEKETLQVKVQQAELVEQRDYTPSHTMCSLLMSDNNHALTSKVFLALLRLMLQQLSEGSSIGLLSNEEELAHFLQSKYQLKMQLLVALELLVWHPPLKAQLAQTQSKQFMQLLSELLQQRLSNQKPTVEADQTLLVCLMLLQELLESSEQLQLAESTQRLLKPLQQLAAQTPNELVKQATRSLLSLLLGDRVSTQPTADRSAFQTARELIEQKKPHLQVYGIQLIVQALRNKDVEFTSQCHRILALALETLKSNQESYTFLNCVRLFVALVHIMESEVLDLLSAEYLAETAQLDYRLLVGEAILKSAQEIGPLCYRYKIVLLNCFLHGTKSPLDELRTSSYANLAQLCRLLAYQVHSFFQELLQLINDELSFGSYLPAKRGALLVLAELLAGMENLLDYQDILLPVYRLLRAIEANEDADPQMRQHAANGLKTLNAKCREMLQTSVDPLEQMQREIKVLGIKEPVASSSKKQRHILELN